MADWIDDDPLMLVRTPEDARAFILETLSAMTAEDRAFVVGWYFGMDGMDTNANANMDDDEDEENGTPQIGSRDPRVILLTPPPKRPRLGTDPPVARRGGGGGSGHDDRDLDPRIVRMLSQIDRRHDFGYKPSPGSLPRELEDGRGNPVWREKRFVRACFSTPTFTFQDAAVGDPIPNPAAMSPRPCPPDVVVLPANDPNDPTLRREDGRTLVLYDTVDEAPSVVVSAAPEDVPAMRARHAAWLRDEMKDDDAPIWHVDVWPRLPDDLSRSLTAAIRLYDVLQLLTLTRARYGDDVSLVVDASARGPGILQVVIALRLVDATFWDLFVVDDDEVGVLDVRALREAVRAHLGTNSRSWTTSRSSGQGWRLLYTDATVFDAGDWFVDPTAPLQIPTVDLVVDRSATGEVFPPGLGVRLQLLGLDDDDDLRVRARVHDEATGTTVEVGGTKSEMTDSMSTRALTALVQSQREGQSPTLAAHEPLMGLSETCVYALKCAGDWGQVERCRRDGAVFVTCDALAALYARYRGVPCVFLHVQSRGSNVALARRHARYAFALIR